jgi:hypothetical protein
MTVEVQVIIVHNLAGIEGYRRSDDFAVFTGAKKNQSLDIVLFYTNYERNAGLRQRG